MISALKSRFQSHLATDKSDFTAPSASSISPETKRYAAMGAGVAATTGVGALIGHRIGAANEAKDVVTIEHVPYRETERVYVGTRTQWGCYRTNYEGEYGYDPTCIKQVPEYETRYTGRILQREVKHHTVNRPYTALGGAFMGAGIGLAVGIAGSLAVNAILD